MATRSTIAILNKDGTVESVYAHWDGYIGGNGEILYLHYRNVDKIRELLSFGNISSLEPEINPPHGVSHTFDKPYNGVTKYFGRDRGDKDCDCLEYSSFNDYLENGCFHDYDYVFHEKKNEWYVIDHDKQKLQKLTTLLKRDSRVSEEAKKMVDAEKQAEKLNKELKKKTESLKSDLVRYKL